MSQQWNVYAKVQGGKYVGKVTAETAEEAIRKGWLHNNAHVSLCHQCSHHCEDPEVIEIEVEKDE